ncbi:hypothetical protein ACFPM0_01340 [Pseudonocardia sulfidoxydans]
MSPNRFWVRLSTGWPVAGADATSESSEIRPTTLCNDLPKGALGSFIAAA